VPFRGSHDGVYDVSAADVFGVVTSAGQLSKWATNYFENVRPVDGDQLGERSQFRADEPLAEKRKEMGHLYEVIRVKPSAEFALRCIEGPPFEAGLALQKVVGGRTRIRWTFTGAPSRTIDRLLAGLLRSRLQKDCDRAARRHVERLVELTTRD
jgi:hypothetical protein